MHETSPTWRGLRPRVVDLDCELLFEIMIKPEYVAQQLNLDYSQILNIYPYGSQVYGNSNLDSDLDYIIVFKSAFLENGAFRNNAISSSNRAMQGVCYSRTGFIDAINNYEIGALECLSLPDEMIIQKKWDFKIQKFVVKDMVDKIIQKESNSWHAAINHRIRGDIYLAKKGVYHALRILEFGLQLKEHQKIVDFTVTNALKETIMFNDDFHIRDYVEHRDNLVNNLKS